jgi:hypothetical protein
MLTRFAMPVEGIVCTVQSAIEEKVFVNNPGYARTYVVLLFSQNFSARTQGCQLVCFQTKNSNLGKVWRVLEWKVLVYFMVIWNILQSFGIFYVNLLMLW